MRSKSEIFKPVVDQQPNSHTLRVAKVDANYPHELPARHYGGDAGYDLVASRTVNIPGHGFAEIPTNVKVALPEGTWAIIVGRSSTFQKRGLFVNPGIIDNGWRGELLTLVYNFSDKPTSVRRGERVSQLIIFNLVTPVVEEVETLPEGDRGEKGFGSTGGTEEATA